MMQYTDPSVVPPLRVPTYVVSMVDSHPQEKCSLKFVRVISTDPQ